ncbi:MAG: hypothetical protein LUD51_05710 [Clostridia bacterium]|nr:hypothetical protein [Clostridia bacterium]
MYTGSLFTEENLEGMKKLLKRICEEGVKPQTDEVRYCLNAMYDTINSELIDQKETEARLAKLAESNSDLDYFCAISGLRYTPLIFLSRMSDGQQSGPSIIYEGIEGDGVETETMPVYTRRKMVANSSLSSFHWHHTDLDTMLAVARESGFKYIVVNPDSDPLLLDIAKTDTIVSFYKDIDESISICMTEGISAEDLFPALVEKFYFLNAECTFKDGSKKSGLVLVPEDSAETGFELETDEDEDVLVRLEDLALIRAADDETYEEYRSADGPAEEIAEDAEEE